MNEAQVWYWNMYVMIMGHRRKQGIMKEIHEQKERLLIGSLDSTKESEWKGLESESITELYKTQ
jgi:hypothetical protein